MDPFRYSDGVLTCDGLPIGPIADRFGTPLYLYSAAAIAANYRAVADAFADLNPTICYAVKANSNLHILRRLAALGSGMDVVSGNELDRAWLAGVPMDRITFAGTGKTQAELHAALSGEHSPLARVIRDRAGDLKNPRGETPHRRGPVGLINAESEGELERIADIAAELGVTARACLRINPDVDAHTHAYTTTGKKENKFGVDIGRAAEIFASFKDRRGLNLTGLHMHLGSPIASPQPYIEGITAALALIDDLTARGHSITALNIGGGYGVDYGNAPAGRAPSPIADFARAIVPLLKDRAARGLRILLEPGRCIVAPAGILLSRVQYTKRGRTKTFIIGDAGVHTLVRPALYQAYHFIWPARVAPEHTPASGAEKQDLPGLTTCDVVGPVCESSDFLAMNRDLPPVAAGDLLAVFTAGAYGMSMSSNYNEHLRPAEVLVENGEPRLIRARQDPLALLHDELAAGA